MKRVKKTAPELLKISKNKTPFEVPPDYFENFSVRLSDKLQEQVSPQSGKGLIPALKPWFVIASVGIILVISGILVFHPGKNAQYTLNTSDITANVESNIYYYDEETIIDVLYPSAELSEGETSLTDEEIIEYLINNDISINDIMNAI